jgi:hypothetical protein
MVGRSWLTARLFLAFLLVAAHAIVAAAQTVTDPRLSSAGRLARDRVEQLANRLTIQGGGCFNEPECEDAPLLASSLQSETTIAVDATGQHVVVGFNDFRGFRDPTRFPTSISGFMYSDDGGLTFVDGGQLPSPGNGVLFGQLFPQIFGDPDVKYVGACTFVYTSLALEKFGNAGLVQSLVFHRSTDCGHTWAGPFDIPPSVNPNGGIDTNGDASDAADKELTDVDPDTGRFMVCWSNFTTAASGGVEISCTFSDDVLSTTPTFAPRRVVAARPTDGQGSAVRFAGNGSNNAVIAWSSFPSFYTNRVSFARSTDNGTTWSAPVDLTPSFVTMDQVLGNDRVNSNPSVAIDTSSGPFSGNVYVVYSNNNSRDGADVAFQRSTDGGVTFSAPFLLNSRPGNDRAQWFPYVTVDRTTGRVTVFYYDQGIDTSGDLTEVTYTSSDDGGVTWSAPAPLTDRPFKAGWGNDANQPNLGDYNQAVAQLATLYVSYAITRPVKFTDGQPATTLPTPDVEAKTVPSASRAPVRLGSPSFTDSGANGNIDPGEEVAVRLPLTNYVTNPLNSATITAVTATLTSATPGITVLQASAVYLDILPATTTTNLTDYRLEVSPAFTPGTPIELTLAVSTTQGPATLPVTLQTGTPVSTMLLSEDFDAVPPGTIPFGWTRSHGAGPNTVPWTTSNTFAPSGCGDSNKAFHQEANDATGSNQARWERLFSPTITVPALSDYVTVEFDVCYDTEDDPVLPVLAYDGFFLRVTDVTPGRTLRSLLAEAVEEEFTTDGFKHYPKHFPRNSDQSYFEDMSVWAGYSAGTQRVRLKIPGMAGSQFQLRFEYAQDQLAVCTDLRPGHVCGVSVDNVVVRNVVSAAQPSVSLAVSQTLARDADTNEIVATLMVTNTGSAVAAGVILTSVLLGTTAPTTALPALGDIAPGASATAVVRFPPSAGAPGDATLLRVLASYSGGSIGGTFRVILP